jgi:hypothetical protein
VAKDETRQEGRAYSRGRGFLSLLEERRSAGGMVLATTVANNFLLGRNPLIHKTGRLIPNGSMSRPHAERPEANGYLKGCLG